MQSGNRQKSLSRRLALLLLLLVLGLTGILLWQFLPQNNTSRSADALMSGPLSGLSSSNVFPAYGGSASCRECHAQAYEKWAQSHHALAERGVEEIVQIKLTAEEDAALKKSAGAVKELVDVIGM